MFGLTFAVSRLHVATYLLLVALFSISFLVFLNASISFLITERIGLREGVGDAVGTLSFADELLALVACPLWGVVSDRIGVRTVAVSGYVIVGLGLWACTWATSVYPSLLFARLLFSVGGAATATMVTAILPAMARPTASAPSTPIPETPNTNQTQSHRHSVSPSISSELTITPARFRSFGASALQAKTAEEDDGRSVTTSRLAGLVGMFTGLGALVALFVFFPMPSFFEGRDLSASDAVAASFYIVGSIAYVVAAGCFFGLRNLPGEEDKSPLNLLRNQRWRSFLGVDSPADDEGTAPSIASSKATQMSSHKALRLALILATRSPMLALAYIGGFVARASSVAISLFIPLAVNAHFIETGRCDGRSGDHGHDVSQLPPGDDIKRTCSVAYRLAGALTGVSQLAALLCAPIFGFLAAAAWRKRQASASMSGSAASNGHGSRNRRMRRSGQSHDWDSQNKPPRERWSWPLVGAATAGLVGNAWFASLSTPEPSPVDGGSPVVFVATILMGIGQIGAIVCSLALLSRCISSEESGSAFGDFQNGVHRGNGDLPRGDQTPSSIPVTPATPNESNRPSQSFMAAYRHHNVSSTAVTTASESSPLLPRRLSFHAQSTPATPVTSTNTPTTTFHTPTTPLAQVSFPDDPDSEINYIAATTNRHELKGAIAGIYSLFGGAAILMLTKIGGMLFDRVSPSAPFWIMVGADAAVVLVGLVVGLWGELRQSWGSATASYDSVVNASG